MFRWCFFQEGKGKGWDREIKYNKKEYLQLFEKVQELRQRFQAEYQRDIAAVEIEKVAYVLGRRDGGVSEDRMAKGESPSLKRKAPAGHEVRDKLDNATTLDPRAETATRRPSKRVKSSQS